MSDLNAPYTSLGNHLKYVREQSKQSRAEVSGAVEIDEEQLERIESGLERPNEDILLLLISHFKVQDREAVQLWELAEYDSDMPEEIKLNVDIPRPDGKSIFMLLAMDTRTIYSDGMDVVVNPAGVTLQFTQMTGPTKSTAVSRIGMSHQQAEQVVKVLQQALIYAKYSGNTKLLPPSSSEK